MEIIKIKYLRGIQPLEILEQGDWIDLRAAEDIHLLSGESMMIPLGVAMELPQGYEAIIAPRSSTFKKHGIICVNSIGIVDESYKGDNDEWHFPVLAMRSCRIKKDERICQFRIIRHQPPLHLQTVESLGNEDRGGFGSTGRV